MLSQKGLFVFLEQSAGTHPDRIALIEPSGYSIHYGELEALSNRVRDRLHHIGIRRGDRVGDLRGAVPPREDRRGSTDRDDAAQHRTGGGILACASPVK